MATDWSEEAKAARSASAKKAAATRKANQAKKTAAAPNVNSPEFLAAQSQIIKRIVAGDSNIFREYFTNSRVARWALSNVSVIAMMRGTRIRWGRPTLQMRLPFHPDILRG